MKELFRVAYELDRRNLPFALVTVIGTDGIIPRQNGRMLVREDGSFISTIPVFRGRMSKSCVKTFQTGSYHFKSNAETSL